MADYDLISKTALLRHLDMAIECKDCPRNTDRKTYYDRCACSEVADICNIITEFATFADVQPVKQWTNIKDKLPDEDGAYLCYLESGIICEANYDSTIASEGDFPFGEWVTYYNSDTLGAEDNYWEAYDAITHWMPLPEPPKDGEQNDD